jgi:hypothetical protein
MTVAQISVWKVLDAGISFATQLMDVVKELQQEFEYIFGPEIVIFRAIAPDVYATRRKMARADGLGDLCWVGEERTRDCIPGTIRFASLKRETKIPNTTKLKVSYTASGEKYDLFVIV